MQRQASARRWLGRVTFALLLLAVASGVVWLLVAERAPRSGPPAEARYLLPIVTADGAGVIAPDGTEILPAVYESVRLFGEQTTEGDGLVRYHSTASASPRPAAHVYGSVAPPEPTVWIVTERRQSRREFIRHWPFVQEKDGLLLYEVWDSSATLFLRVWADEHQLIEQWPLAVVAGTIYVAEPTGFRRLTSPPDLPESDGRFIRLSTNGYLQLNDRIYDADGDLVLQDPDVYLLGTYLVRIARPETDIGDILDLQGRSVLPSGWQMIDRIRPFAFLSDGYGIAMLLDPASGRSITFPAPAIADQRWYGDEYDACFFNDEYSRRAMYSDWPGAIAVFWSEQRVALLLGNTLLVYDRQFNLLSEQDLGTHDRVEFTDDGKGLVVIDRYPRGKRIIRPDGRLCQFEKAFEYDQDFVIGQGDDGRVGLLASDGTWLLPAEYARIRAQDASPPNGYELARSMFIDTAMVVAGEGRVGIVATDGRWIIEPRQYTDWPFESDTAHEYAVAVNGSDLLVLNRVAGQLPRLNDGPPLPRAIVDAVDWDDVSASHFRPDMDARPGEIVAATPRWAAVRLYRGHFSHGGPVITGLFLYDRQTRTWWPRMIKFVYPFSPDILLIVEDDGTYRYLGPDGVIWETGQATAAGR